MINKIPFSLFTRMWGRYNKAGQDRQVVLIVSLLFVTCPILVALMVTSCRVQDCQLTSSLWSLLVEPATLWEKYWDLVPFSEVRYCAVMLTSWILFQALLYCLVPVMKMSHGSPTPSGQVLSYHCNGFSAYCITLLTFITGWYGDWWSGSVVADHWLGIFVISNVIGYSLTLFAYLKSQLFPNSECQQSGSLIYDLFMGVELNPRFGNFDWKLFWNGRPGIIGWSVINLSFAAAQYQRYGTVTNSMILVNLLQLLYVADFFWYEDWYLRTIDIAHDHFGFYLAWGDTVWLPFMYTLQSQYLLVHPNVLGWEWIGLIVLLGLAGYSIFREANNQKDRFRQASSPQNAPKIWSQPVTYLPVNYVTVDSNGVQTPRTSNLLTSGFFGLARHFNYLGDLMLSLSMCLATGSSSHIFPYFYFFYMTVLLVHREWRDETKCRDKYGQGWSQYVEKVPWRIVPYLY